MLHLQSAPNGFKKFRKILRYDDLTDIMQQPADKTIIRRFSFRQLGNIFTGNGYRQGMFPKLSNIKIH